MARRQSVKINEDSTGLGKRTARGFYWLMLNTVGSKVITLGSQVALGWLLAPEDFDLIALMLTVTSLLNLLRDAGMREILVHRHRHFARWAGAAFWLSLTTGVIVGLLTLASIPIALAVYQKPELSSLLIVSAISAPISTLGTVSDALVRAQMRFRLLSMISLFVYLGQMILTVALAAMGFGAMSWILPQPVVWLLRAILLWWIAKPKFSMRPRFKRWRYLFMDNLYLMGSDLAMVATNQGDRAVLGIMFPLQPFAGIYFFALNLTAQSIRLFVQNLTNVLFPALSKLQDEPVRQTRAYLRATSLLALVGVPLCLVQMPLADSLISLAFPAKWQPAVQVVQWLSFGMMGRLMTAPSRGMFMAQGRFRALMWMSIINAITFIGFVVAGAAMYGLYGVAAMASASMFFYGPAQIYIAAKPGGGTWRDVFKTYALPLLASAIAIGVAWPSGEFLNYATRSVIAGKTGIYAGYIAEFISILLLTGAVYLLVVAKVAPDEMRELKSRVRDMLARKKRKGKPTVEEIEKDAADVEAVEEIRSPDE